MPVLSNRPLPQQVRRRSTPLWEGPSSDGPQGGVTFSLLSYYLACKERFRIKVMEGLKPADTFNHRLEFGSMFHICEQYHAPGKLKGRRTHASPDWRDKLHEYAESLMRRYPLQQQEVQHWYNVCAVQFPIYAEHWEKHPDEAKPAFREQRFQTEYKLSSGRKVFLRGKWDGVDYIDGKAYLFEHKTKGDVVEAQIKRQLTFDLQTMLYLIALNAENDNHADQWKLLCPLGGLRYNIVRRPLSGGKHTITRHKSTKSKPEETHEEFYERLGGLIKDNPDHFFIRFRSEVSESDRTKFRHECLDPVLENLCDDYEWWQNCYGIRADHYNNALRAKMFRHHAQRHFRMPFGVYSPLQEGRPTDLDSYLQDGTTVGLRMCDDLFPELKDGPC